MSSLHTVRVLVLVHVMYIMYIYMYVCCMYRTYYVFWENFNRITGQYDVCMIDDDDCTVDDTSYNMIDDST